MIAAIFITSLFIFGIHALFQEGMLLGFAGDKIRSIGDHTQEKFNIDIAKPLTECPPCMASFWGLLAFPFTGLTVVNLLVFLIALAGLNYIINVKIF